LKVSELIKRVEADGWILVRTTGGHSHYKHPLKPGLVTSVGRTTVKFRDSQQHPEAGETEMSEYVIVLEREGDAWGAYAPDFPGFGVAGATQEEVEALAKEALTAHIALLREHGEPVPHPAARVTFVAVA
jgi:predicted RNase H-like HicB family nuclease/predicted RNA binding protein YcfA (HicA-like mRNA interferase family)